MLTLTVGQVFCVLTGTGVSNLIQPSLLGTSVATYTLYTYLCDKKSSTVHCTLYCTVYIQNLTTTSQVELKTAVFMKNWKKGGDCICSEHQYVHILMYTVPKNNLNLYILYDQASTASSMTGHIFLYEDNTSLNFRCHQKIENTAFSLIYFPFFLSFSLPFLRNAPFFTHCFCFSFLYFPFFLSFSFPFLRKAPFFTHSFCFSGSVLGGGYI